MKKILLVILVSIVPSQAFASNVWTGLMTDFNLYMDNGTVYVSHVDMSSNCSNDRAQITMDNTAYNNALYAYILSSYKTELVLKNCTVC